MQGNPVQEATLVLRLGGRHVTEQLMNQVKVTTYYVIITMDISITIIISIIFLVVITVTSMIKSCSRGILISPFFMIVNQSHPSTCSPLFWPDQPFNFIMDWQEIPWKLQKCFFIHLKKTKIWKGSETFIVLSYSTANTPFPTTTSCFGERRRRQTSQFLRGRRSSGRWRWAKDETSLNPKERMWMMGDYLHFSELLEEGYSHIHSTHLLFLAFNICVMITFRSNIVR